MKKILNDFLDNKIKFEKYQLIGIFFLLVVLSGVFGYVYEFIFYYFNFGMTEFYLQGGNFMPWINIYAIGAIIIVLLTRKVKKKPFIVFLIGFFSTGILEYFSGLIIFKLGNGVRYWDYNTEILNFGNIGGFVCLRSVLFFGVSALILMYLMIPFLIFLSKKMTKKSFMILSITLFSIIMFDEIYNLLFTRLFNLPSAISIYKSLGFKYH